MSRSIKEQKQAEKEAKKQRRIENLKRAEENRKKSDIVQVVSKLLNSIFYKMYICLLFVKCFVLVIIITVIRSLSDNEYSQIEKNEKEAIKNAREKRYKQNLTLI